MRNDLGESRPAEKGAINRKSLRARNSPVRWTSTSISEGRITGKRSSTVARGGSAGHRRARTFLSNRFSFRCGGGGGRSEPGRGEGGGGTAMPLSIGPSRPRIRHQDGAA